MPLNLNASTPASLSTLASPCPFATVYPLLHRRHTWYITGGFTWYSTVAPNPRLHPCVALKIPHRRHHLVQHRRSQPSPPPLRRSQNTAQSPSPEIEGL